MSVDWLPQAGYLDTALFVDLQKKNVHFLCFISSEKGCNGKVRPFIRSSNSFWTTPNYITIIEHRVLPCIRKAGRPGLEVFNVDNFFNVWTTVTNG